MNIEPYVQSLLEALVMLVCVLAAFGLHELRKYLIQKMGSEEFEKTAKILGIAKEVTTSAVRYLEQAGVLHGWNGEEKKERAIIYVRDQLAKYGVDMSFGEIDTLIEEAVQVMNAEVNQFVLPPGEEQA